MPEHQKIYRTIKALVFDHIHRTRGRADYDELTKTVLEYFPESRWKPSHWAWYRSQIGSGRFKGLFSDEERRNLREQGKASVRPQSPSSERAGQAEEDIAPRYGPEAKSPEVKALGDPILERTRTEIAEAADGNELMRFKLNRWVHSRLLQDEIRAKMPVKNKLWDSGIHACQACGQPFSSPKGLELHRRDPSMGYSVENCELLCKECHVELSK